MVSRGDLVKRGVVLVVVVVVVLAGATLFALGTAPPGVEGTTGGYPETGEMLPDRAAASGTPDVEPAANDGVVLVDNSHSNRYTDDQIRPLISALSATGYTVEEIGARAAFTERLSEADTLVVVDPGEGFTDNETEAVEAFVADGGHVVLLGEPTRVEVQATLFGASITDVESELGPLGSRLGIDFGTEYLYNLQRNEGNFKRIYAGGTSALSDVDRAAFYTATRVSAPEGQTLLTAAEGTRLSGNDVAQRFPVAARTENVLAVGDTTFLSGGKHAVADNEQFLAYVAEFAASGDRTRSVSDYPYVVDDEVTLRYTGPVVLNGTQRVARDLEATGRETRIQFGNPDPNRTDVLVLTYDSLAVETVDGLTVRPNRVEVDGNRAPRDRTAVVWAPDSGYDLVIAAEDEAAVERATRVLVTDGIDRYALTDRLALVRSGPRSEETTTATPSSRNGTSQPPRPPIGPSNPDVGPPSVPSNPEREGPS